VFTREEDSFAADDVTHDERDPDDARGSTCASSTPRATATATATPASIGPSPRCSTRSPDIVHIGHLNHLSTSLILEAARREIPIVYTLHDYWVMCPSGQFMQTHPVDPNNLWAACDGQDDRKCAERCYSRYFSGADDEHVADSRLLDRLGRPPDAARPRHGRARRPLHRPGAVPRAPLPRGIRTPRPQADVPRLRLRSHAPRRSSAAARASPSPSATSARTSPRRASTSSLPRSAGCAATPACGSGADRAARTPPPCRRSPLVYRATLARVSSGCPSIATRRSRATCSTTSTRSSSPRSGSRTRRSSSTRPNRRGSR
jgi:hypothetical protein